jgi:hypothetical protein
MTDLGGAGSAPGTTPSGPTVTAACASAPVDVPVAFLLRMTGPQYLNTERALFNQPQLALPLEAGDTTVISQLEAQKIDDAAAAAVATGGHHALVPCDFTGAGSDACAQGFIDAFGQRAFRRPVTSDEEAWLMGVYHGALATQEVSPPFSFEEAVDIVAQVIIEAPQHLYISAQGVDDASLPPGLRRMTGYERATRLSYALTNTTPDDTLLAAAASGALDTTPGLRDQAQRLLDSPAGHELTKAFAASYLTIDATVKLPALEALPKDPARFPFDSPALRSAMRTESEALYESIFYAAGGSFSKLMTSTDAYVNQPLAELYGVSNGPQDATTFAWVTLVATQRAGLFTRAAFLTQYANQDYQSPIRRGVHLFKQTLCQVLGPPPPNVDMTPPAATQMSNQSLSVRQQTELRTSPALCTSCHAQFNPMGFALGHYDAMGAWELADTGTNPDGTSFSALVDSTADMPGTDLKGTLTGGVDLSQKLASSTEALDCMASRWFSTLQGRPQAPQDACTLAAISSGFKQSSDMHAMVLDAVTSAPSLYVRVSP